jgi:hypothetical protein
VVFCEGSGHECAPVFLSFASLLTFPNMDYYHRISAIIA